MVMMATIPNNASIGKNKLGLGSGVGVDVGAIDGEGLVAGVGLGEGVDSELPSFRTKRDHE